MPVQTYCLTFVIIMMLIIVSEQNRLALRRRRMIKRKKKTKGASVMSELVLEFVGKECYIACPGYTTFCGKIEKIEDNWIKLIEKNGLTRVINLDYVNDIKEIKRKEK